jgi:Na+-transporting NADH:ubiquinone oxidoreductase subunit A
MIRIRKGLDVPIAGEPVQAIEDGPDVRTVALVADDSIGMRPTMHVREGDAVRAGQLVFEDKKTPGVHFTAPGSGRVVAVHRGAKRKFQSLVIELDGDDGKRFDSYEDVDLTSLGREQVERLLLDSGLWTALRVRPYSKVPVPGSWPHSIFVTAMDTNPLAARPEVVIAEHELEFVYGLQVIRHLTEGKVYICKSPDASVPTPELPFAEFVDFAGPHPAGLAGTHIHFLDPVGRKKQVWHLNYQDLIAIGRLFVTGELMTERVIALGGPVVERPRLIRTRLGACLDDLVAGQLTAEDVRVISGSPLSGRQSVSPTNYLGRYHLQVSALQEGRQREFLGWQRPGWRTFSATRAFASAFFGRDQRFDLTTSLNGSPRPMVPIASYDRVMPLDVIPVYLLRSLIIRDTEQAQALGCLELDEEDLALCTFVCPGKYEYGPILRENLKLIEKEG